jgi:translation initiation factor IF-2
MEKIKKEKAKTVKKDKEKKIAEPKAHVKAAKPKVALKTAAKAIEKKEKPLPPVKEAVKHKAHVKVAVKKAETVQPAPAPVHKIEHPSVVTAVKEKVIKKEEVKKPEPLKPVLKHAQPHVKAEPKPELKPEPKPEPKLEPKPVAGPVLKDLEMNIPISVKDLSVKLQEKPSVLIKNLMGLGIMAGINQSLDNASVEKICLKYGFKPKEALGEEEAMLAEHKLHDSPETLKPRSPIVTLMGHVDHGKTSLLDAIRKSKVAESEHGGITQHIGAYRVKIGRGEITFLDTPGHEAFTAMRARGASVTDIVVLVVAADDGIMPQTQEAIDHARAAGVSIIVAINKIDKPQAEIDRVKKQLSGVNLTAEDWGGKTITVPVSAKTGEGIDRLLEMILLEAEILELKSNPQRHAKGVVLEAKMVKSKGPVSTLLVQTGTLHLNENIIVGDYYGKIRAMFNDRGQSVTVAGPSIPVEVLGITGMPLAGEQFFVIEDEKTAKDLALKRQEKDKQKQMQPVKRLGLEDLYSQIKAGKLKELKLVLKGDAQGSVEAIKDVLGKINSQEVQLNIIHDGIGNINTSDVILAVASEALILGFNVVIDEQAKALVEKEGQEVRTYNVIYELANDIKAALEGMLEPKLKKVFLGRAEVRKVFRLSSHGIIAGCMVTKGKFARSSSVTLVRNGQDIFEGELSSLKRFKDDVREVEEGFECGMALKGFAEVMEGDVIEAFSIQKIARTLE